MQPLGMDDPRWIGDYRLLGVLGAGGMGRVYLGRNSGGRTVAVKVIRPDLMSEEFRARFRREVTAARRVGGAFTAPVLDADVDANPPWLATGYVAGFSLADAVAQFGTFTEDAVLVLARGLAEALDTIHAAGVVHRDLKPSNVLLALDGPKVIDFGIARAMEDTALTTTGKVIGSPGFMCPEQVTGEPVVPASDVFALGGILVFACAGHGPFGSGDTVQMLWRVVYEQPRLDAVPERLRPVVAACLNKDVQARPTPRQLMDHFDSLGVPATSGWLPNPVLHEVSRRAIQLLDLDSGSHEVPRNLQAPASPSLPGTARTDPTATHDPTRPPGGPYPAPGGSHPHGSYPPPNTSGAHPTQAPGAAYPGQSPSAPAPTRTAPATYPGGQTYPVGAQNYAPGGPAHDNSTGWSAPPTGRGPSEAPARERNRSRFVLVTALVVVAVGVGAGAFLVGTQLQRPAEQASSVDVTTSEYFDPGPLPETTETEPTEATGDSVVPDEFIGTWAGTASDGLLPYEIEITITGGNTGDTVATSTNGGALGVRCTRFETLTGIAENTLTLAAQLDTATSPKQCTDNGDESTLTLRPDGTIAYTTPAPVIGMITGVLQKSS